MITGAMMSHPEMVAGTGRPDTVLMSAASRRIFVKGGGEAIVAVGVPGRHFGLAAKIEDGGGRALAVVAIEALRQLEVLTEDDLPALAPHLRPPIHNRRGLQVGEIRPVLTLK